VKNGTSVTGGLSLAPSLTCTYAVCWRWLALAVCGLSADFARSSGGLDGMT
jgi:hypothetical protein